MTHWLIKYSICWFVLFPLEIGEHGSLYPNEDELFETYKTLGKAFDEAIMAEIRYRNKIIEPQLVSITDLAGKLAEKLVDISEGLSEAINGAIERNRKEIEDVHNV